MTQNPEQRPPERKQIRGEYWHRQKRVSIPEGYMAVGIITGAHGIRGEVKVELHTDNPDRFSPGATILRGGQLIEAKIEEARAHKGQLLVRFADTKDRSQAEALRGEWLFIAEADAGDLEPDTYWIHDIIGLSVKDHTGRTLGKVIDVLATGANEVYVVETEPGVNQGRELLLPAIADVIEKVDLEHQEMTVVLMPGLLEED